VQPERMLKALLPSANPFCNVHTTNQWERTSWTIQNRMEEVMRVTHPESIPVTVTGKERLA